MNRSDVAALHYIAPIENVPSIMEHGILSNRRAARLPHRSVALEEIQERRRDRQIPNVRLLHEYVNLYFDAPTRC
ncbi:MAG: DarT ssDNA thymidine ADP-ribosyltransferase family protein [Nitrospirota bacterium]